MPLDMFRVPAFSGAVAATAGRTFGMHGAIFLLPLTWQNGGMLAPLEAALS